MLQSLVPVWSLCGLHARTLLRGANTNGQKGVWMWFYFFRELLFQAHRRHRFCPGGPWCRQCLQDCSTWRFRSLPPQHFNTSDADASVERSGLYKLLNAAMLHIHKNKRSRGLKQRRGVKTSGRSHESHATVFFLLLLLLLLINES